MARAAQEGCAMKKAIGGFLMHHSRMVRADGAAMPISDDPHVGKESATERRTSAVGLARAVAAAIFIFTAPTAPLFAQPITEITGPASGTNALALAGTRPQPRIVNGVETFDYPSVGALLYTNYEGTGLTPDCTATLVGCQTVLTAAHCVCFYPGTPDNPELVPMMGQQCITLGVAEAIRPRLVFSLPDAGEFHVAAVSVHPRPRKRVGGDLALLLLDRPVTGIVPAAINFVAKPAFGTPGVIVGFGASSAVGGALNAEGAGIKRTGRIVTHECGISGAQNDTQVCWGFDEPVGPPGEDSDTCYGDSGGPLFVNAGEGLVLAGVTSSGSNDDCAPSDDAYDGRVCPSVVDPRDGRRGSRQRPMRSRRRSGHAA
jgi:hypothetical protein